MKNLLKTIVQALILLGMAGSANASILIHDYQLNNDLTDSLGGDALVAHGGVLVDGGYSFGKNQGLMLSSSLMSADNYSIALSFNFSTLGGASYQKIIDFDDGTSDNGLYSSGSYLLFWPERVGHGSGPILTALQYATLVITRDNSLNLFSAYVNGVQALSFMDTSRVAVFSDLNPIARFFEDDSLGSEAAPGTVDSIRVWNGALTASEVANLDAPPLPNPLPLPGTLWLLGAALAGLSMSNKLKQA